MNSSLRSAASALLLSLFATTVSASTIETTSTPTQFNFNCLGTSSSCGQTFGQSFTVGSDTFLDSISFDFSPIQGGSLDVVLRLFSWDGTDRQGSELFASATTTLTTDGLTGWSIGEELTSGQQYMAYIDTAGLGNTTNQSSGFAVVAGSTYTEGTFAWERNSGDNNWNSIGSFDARFVANFSSPTPVPVPAAGLLLLSGLASVAALRRGRKQKT